MKRTFFKKLTLTISVLLIFCAFAIGAQAASPSDFVDFPTGWSNEAVTAAVNNGLLNGRSANRIEPEGNLTRAEMATIINRAFGATVEKNISSFGDVSPNEWYYHEIAKAYNMQTFQGDASGTMRPDSYITREEVFAVIARALVLETTDYSPLNRFADTYAVSEWAKPYAAILVAKGYVNGDNLGNLNPLANITREEFAQIMHNIIKTYHITAGTHTYAGPASTLIRVGGVTLSDVTVEGDLILGDGVGKGNVNLVNVTIKGRLLARGGEGKVTLTNTTVAGGVVVKDVNGVVNFNNYRSEEPFKGIREITKATFIGETGTTPTPGGSTGGGGGGGGGGGSSTPSANTYRYIVNYYLENIDGTYTIHSSSINKSVSKNTTVYPYKDFENYTFVVGSPSSEKVTSIKVTRNLNYNYYYNLKTYSVSISLPGGGTWSETFKHGETLGSKFAFSSYPGVKFVNSANGSEVTASTTVTSAMTIISKSPYTVTFNHNDGMGGVTEKTVYSGDTIGTNLPIVTRTGYTFDKWTVNSDGSGEEIGASTVISGPVTAYAQWNLVEYDINYISRFAFATTVQDKYNIETGATLPGESAFASHTGFIFDGWYMEDSFATKVSSIPVGSHGNVTLYARWIDENKTYYDFTFDYQYDSKAETVKVEQNHTANKPTDPVRTGYTFGGWFTDPECTSAYIFSTPVTANKTIYAKWTANEYDIAYDLKGGSFKQGASYPSKYTVDILPLNLPTSDALEYEGMKFLGWYKDSELSQPVSQIPANTTGEFKVYAKWEPKTYEVTIITPGVPNEIKNFTHGQTIGDVITQEPTRNGYTFVGYNTAENGSGTSYTSTSAVTSDIGTLYTQWSAITYHLTHDLNGGVALPGVNTVIDFNIEQSVNLLTHNVHFSKLGYDFDGWYKTSDFSDTAITSIPVGTFEDITVYAKWDAKTYKVFYDGNTNTSGTMDYTSHKYGEVTYLRDNAFFKTGHKFLGWSKVQGASVADYNDKADVVSIIAELEAQNKSEIILYAVWEAETYTLTFNVSGGNDLTTADLPAGIGYTIENGKAKVTVKYNSTYPQLPTPTHSDISKKFVGWEINGVQINQGETVNITANSDVVAVWTDKAVHTVTIYDFSEGNSKTVNVIDGEKIGSLTGMKKTGYTFDKFYKKGTTEVFDIVNTVITGPVEIDAGWIANTYTIKYNGNGNTSGLMTDSSHTYGQTSVLSQNVFAKTGHTFLGWTKTQGSQTVNYTDKADAGAILAELAASDTREITLYAVWSANSYSVKYDKNDASAEGTMTNSNHFYGIASNLSPNAFTKTGYSFVGWNTSADGSGTKFNDGEEVTGLSENDGATVTLYAQWEIIEYAISYYGVQFVDPSAIPYTYTIEDEIILPGAGSIKQSDEGDFLYWEDENGMPVDKILKGTIGNRIFTAKFSSQQVSLFTVNFIVDGEKFNELKIFDGETLNSNVNYKEPVKAKHNFLGWNTKTDGSGTTYIPGETPVTAGVTLYAIWEEIPLENFTITYNNVDTADMKNAPAFITSYTEEDEITLPVASDFNERANGEVFAGWYGNDAFAGDPITTIPKGSTGDKKYWAKWAQNYVVRFYRGAVVVDENHRKYIGDAKVPAGTSMLQSDIDNMISAVTKESTVEYYDGSYSHTVEGELWYVDSDEWKLFNSEVVVDRDIDVFYANKFVSLCLNVELGGFSLDIPGYISVPYNSETRIVESAKDLMAAARGKLSLALSTDDIYAKAIEKAAEKAAEKTSEKGIVLMDTQGNLKFVEIDTAISNIIKPEEIDGEIAKYIEKIIVENSDDEKIESATRMAIHSQLITDTVLGGMAYDFTKVKSHISGLNESQRIDFADKLHDALYAEPYYHDFIDAFEEGHDHFVVTNENIDFVMAVATAVNEYSYEELKDRIYAKFGKVIKVLGDDIAKEFMQDAQKRYYDDAHILWDDVKSKQTDADYKASYPSYLTFKVNAVDHLFKPLFNEYRVKVINKLIEKDFYHYTENTYLRELVEMDADTIVNDLLYKVPKTEENIGYALWPRENGESGFMHYYDYLFQKLLIADDARLWYVNNLSPAELELLREDVYDKAAKALNKANEMLAAYEKDGSLPMGKNISDLMEIEAFAKIFNKVEDKLIKALEKFKTTQFYGKQWDGNSVRYDIPYGDLAGDVILGTDDPVFNVDSLLDDENVNKALEKAGFKDFEDDFDSSIGSTVTVQSIERLFRNNRIEIRRYYE